LIEIFQIAQGKKDKELLEKVQRRFTKMIFNIEGLNCEDRLWYLKL